MQLIFTNEYASLLLLLNGLMILLFVYARKNKKERAMEFGNFETLKKVTSDSLIKSSTFLLILKLLAITAIIVGISSPVLILSDTGSDADWTLTLDRSASMFTSDIEPTRFDAAKDISQSFVSELGDSTRIGVVSYGGQAESIIEPVYETEPVNNAIQGLNIGDEPGTATGNAIIESSNMLENIDNGEREKNVVLITDGRQNVGTGINESIEYANNRNITIYTLGLGEVNESEGEISEEELFVDGEEATPGQFPNLNIDRLNRISEETGGESAFVAEREGFEAAFIEIIEDERDYEISEYLILIGAFFLVLEWVFKTTNYEVMPS